MRRWDIESLRRAYRTAKFKVGEKDNGDKIKLKIVRVVNLGGAFQEAERGSCCCRFCRGISNSGLILLIPPDPSSLY